MYYWRILQVLVNLYSWLSDWVTVPLHPGQSHLGDYRSDLSVLNTPRLTSSRVKTNSADPASDNVDGGSDRSNQQPVGLEAAPVVDDKWQNPQVKNPVQSKSLWPVHHWELWILYRMSRWDFVPRLRPIWHRTTTGSRHTSGYLDRRANVASCDKTWMGIQRLCFPKDIYMNGCSWACKVDWLVIICGWYIARYLLPSLCAIC